MSATSFLNGSVVLQAGDCFAVLRTLPDSSIDAVVTDPPYGLSREPDAAEVLRHWLAGNDYVHAGAGFMGKSWDSFVPGPAVWRECLRVLKPGGHLLAFFGTRTYDLGAMAIRLARFEMRDTAAWMFGQGFPKSLDMSKAIDKEAGAEREVVGRAIYGDGNTQNSSVSIGFSGCDPAADQRLITAPATDAALRWEGWGTALKPAFEPIVLARKPLSEATIAANVLRWGTGALNIDGCRVEGTGNKTFDRCAGERPRDQYRTGTAVPGSQRATNLGRWPANLLHDGSDEVLSHFPMSRARHDGATDYVYKRSNSASIYGTDTRDHVTFGYGDSGSAARFFFSAKADADDRLGSKHPTVKPVDLMRWLVRLVTPPGGTVLDPFAGTGTTGEAAWREGFRAVLIERETEYQADIARRMALCLAGPGERIRQAAKARHGEQPAGPLFDSPVQE